MTLFSITPTSASNCISVSPAGNRTPKKVLIRVTRATKRLNSQCLRADAPPQLNTSRKCTVQSAMCWQKEWMSVPLTPLTNLKWRVSLLLTRTNTCKHKTKISQATLWRGSAPNVTSPTHSIRAHAPTVNSQDTMCKLRREISQSSKFALASNIRGHCRIAISSNPVLLPLKLNPKRSKSNFNAQSVMQKQMTHLNCAKSVNVWIARAKRGSKAPTAASSVCWGGKALKANNC
jgi:hypothetical protein